VGVTNTGAPVLSDNLAFARRRHEGDFTVLRAGANLTAEAIAGDVAELAASARAALGEPDAVISATYELRYRGQAFELAVPAPADAAATTPEQLRAAFEAAHEERYGYRDAAAEIELVTMRVSATTTAPQPASIATSDGGAVAGTTFPGPTVVSLPEATLVIPRGWLGTALADGTIDVRRAAGGAREEAPA